MENVTHNQKKNLSIETDLKLKGEDTNKQRSANSYYKLLNDLKKNGIIMRTEM